MWMDGDKVVTVLLWQCCPWNPNLSLRRSLRVRQWTRVTGECGGGGETEVATGLWDGWNFRDSCRGVFPVPNAMGSSEQRMAGYLLPRKKKNGFKTKNIFIGYYVKDGTKTKQQLWLKYLLYCYLEVSNTSSVPLIIIISTYLVSNNIPNFVLRALHKLFHLILTAALYRRNYYPHFTNEETVSERIDNFPKATELKWIKLSCETFPNSKFHTTIPTTSCTHHLQKVSNQSRRQSNL